MEASAADALAMAQEEELWNENFFRLSALAERYGKAVRLETSTENIDGDDIVGDELLLFEWWRNQQKILSPEDPVDEIKMEALASIGYSCTISNDSLPNRRVNSVVIDDCSNSISSDITNVVSGDESAAAKTRSASPQQQQTVAASAAVATTNRGKAESWSESQLAEGIAIELARSKKRLRANGSRVRDVAFAAPLPLTALQPSDVVVIASTQELHPTWITTTSQQQQHHQQQGECADIETRVPNHNPQHAQQTTRGNNYSSTGRIAQQTIPSRSSVAATKDSRQTDGMTTSRIGKRKRPREDSNVLQNDNNKNKEGNDDTFSATKASTTPQEPPRKQQKKLEEPPRRNDEPILEIGSKVKRPFFVEDGSQKNEQWFQGVIKRYDKEHQLYLIEYEDGDSEEVDEIDLKDIIELTRLRDEAEKNESNKADKDYGDDIDDSLVETQEFGIPKTKKKKRKRRKKPKPKDNLAVVYEPFTIKILAELTLQRREWAQCLQKLQTLEIENGSRWEQEVSPLIFLDAKDDNVTETRYLIKWSDLSYLHCSWETKTDLERLIKGSRIVLGYFNKKCGNLHEKKLFGPEERNDGEYFDPSYMEIDRILAVVTNEDHEETETNTAGALGLDKKDDVGADGSHKQGWRRQFLIKWENRPYSESSYEFERDLISNDIPYQEKLQEYTKRCLGQTPSSCDGDDGDEQLITLQQKLLDEGEKEFRRLYKDVFGEKSVSRVQGENVIKFQKYLQEKEHYPNGGKLRDYQAEGVSWLVSNYVNNRSVILADEMGLGKTIQVAAFLDFLASNLYRRGPFLVVVPLSTITNWKRECQGWLGRLNTVIYHGTARDREIIRALEMVYESDRPKKIRSNQLYLKRCASTHNSSKALGNPWMADVVITTPELLTAEDFMELTVIQWECLIVDEAQKIKNFNSKTAMNLRTKFNSNHRILVTGTPIQNRMEELFSLLNFIEPSSFPNCEGFMAKYGNMKEHETLAELHEELQPYILRRLLEDVEKSVPAKEETIIEVELTIAQKQYYRALYEKNVKFLHKNKRKASDGPRLQNLAMQLRKCCNHLYLLNGIKEEFHKQEVAKGKGSSEVDLLVQGSGKLVLLDKLLPRLKEMGHRILLFSQFKIVLDILEDYLYFRLWKFERIDGSITGTRRQQAIDRFQAPNDDDDEKEQPFIMLLSTRAGGFGINLTAADTCIIFDSDWNPQNDLQAQARCHRIGQTKEVKVYRLLTRSTYEQQMFKIASKKLGLDQAVLAGFEGGKDGGLSKDEVELLLRKGAYEILLEDEKGAEAASNAFQEQDIDTILKHNAHVFVHEGTGTASPAKGGKYSKAKFAVTTGDKSTKNEIDIGDPDFWEKMLGASIQADEPNTEEVVGKRVRTVKSYYEGGRVTDSGRRKKNDDDSFEGGEESENDEDDEFLLMNGNSKPKPKILKRPPTAAQTAFDPRTQHNLEQNLLQRVQTNLQNVGFKRGNLQNYQQFQQGNLQNDQRLQQQQHSQRFQQLQQQQQSHQQANGEQQYQTQYQRKQYHQQNQHFRPQVTQQPQQHQPNHPAQQYQPQAIQQTPNQQNPPHAKSAALQNQPHAYQYLQHHQQSGTYQQQRQHPQQRGHYQQYRPHVSQQHPQQYQQSEHYQQYQSHAGQQQPRHPQQPQQNRHYQQYQSHAGQQQPQHPQQPQRNRHYQQHQQQHQQEQRQPKITSADVSNLLDVLNGL